MGAENGLSTGENIGRTRGHSRDSVDPLLAGIDAEGREAIIAESRHRTLRNAQVLFRTGETAEYLFVVRKGRVQFSRLLHTGQEVLMGILGVGGVLGLACLTVPCAYIGTAKALDRGEVLMWPRKVIQRLVRSYPQLSANTLHIALAYVAEFAERHEKLVSATAEQRLARALTRLGVRIGSRSDSGVDVLIKNDQLASLADVSPFTASRVLKRWEREGIVSKGRGSVRIVVPEKLMLE